jgi:hypothetical protein
MFLGHFAAGLVASRSEPRLPLGTAFLAAQLPDAIWPYLLLAGAERVTIAPGDTAMTPLRFDHYPWSHSLAMVVVWGVVAWVVGRAAGLAPRAAVLLLPLALSHWLLDVVSHRPDMPVLPGGGPLLGLGLWNSVPATLVVELGLFAAGLCLYARGRRLGVGFWSLVVVLLVVYATNVAGPPPPSVTAIAVSMIAFVPFLWWWGNRVGFARDAV